MDQRPGHGQREFSLDPGAGAVLFEIDLVPRQKLRPRKDAVALEHRNVLLGDERSERFGDRPQDRQPASLGFGHPLLAVVVAVEDDPLVSLHNPAQQGLERRLELLLRHFFERREDVVE